MCERAKGEPLMQFWFRQFKEEPLRVLIFLVLGALAYMYQEGNSRWEDYRADMKEQNASLILELRNLAKNMSDNALEMKSIDNRLEHLEREHERWRKDCCEK